MGRTVKELLTLKFNEKTNRLYATLLPTKLDEKLSVEEVKGLIQEQGFSDLYIIEASLEEISVKAKMHVPWKGDLAEKKDSEIILTVSEDGLSAFLTLHPPYAGKRAGLAELKAALAKAKITHGIKEAVLKEAIEQGQVEEVIVAEGRLVSHGEKARFKRAYGQSDCGIPETKDFILVSPGDVLVQKIPGSPGISGVNVIGETVPAFAGEDIPFQEPFLGVGINPKDPNQLIALQKGHPVFYGDMARVDLTLILKEVTEESGDVDFKGSVYVKGNVEDDTSIKATGDIFVEGTVYKAILESGGDIVAKKGIIGEVVKRKGSAAEDHDETVVQAKLTAAGSIWSSFVDYARMEVGGSVFAEDHICHSHLDVKDKVILTEVGDKGLLVGGKTKALHGVVASTLGGPSNSRTLIEVGLEKKYKVRYRKLKEDLIKGEKKLDDLGKGLVRSGTVLGRKTSEEDEIKGQIELQSMIQNLANVIPEVSDIIKEKEALRIKIEACENAVVEAKTAVFGGVHVRVHDASYDVLDEMTGGTFKAQGDKVQFIPK